MGFVFCFSITLLFAVVPLFVINGLTAFQDVLLVAVVFLIIFWKYLRFVFLIKVLLCF